MSDCLSSGYSRLLPYHVYKSAILLCFFFFPKLFQLQNQSELRAPTPEKAAWFLDAAIAARHSSQRSNTTEEEHRNSHMLFTLHIYQYRMEKTGKGGSKQCMLKPWCFKLLLLVQQLNVSIATFNDYFYCAHLCRKIVVVCCDYDNHSRIKADRNILFAMNKLWNTGDQSKEWTMKDRSICRLI